MRMRVQAVSAVGIILLSVGSLYAARAMSDVDKINQGKQLVQAIKDVEVKVTQLSQKVAKESDFIKLNCINGKLRLIKGSIKVGEDTLKQMISAGNEAGVTHGFTKLSVVKEQSVALGQEANECVGEELAFVGNTQVNMTEPDNLGGDDPTVPKPAPDLGGGPLWRSPVASPID